MDVRIMKIEVGDRFKTVWVMYEVYETDEYDVDDGNNMFCRMKAIERFGKEAGMIGSTIVISYDRLEELLELRLFISQQKHYNFKSLYEKLTT